MPKGIPAHSREAVKRRAMGRCLRCGGPGAEWHHRRSRSIASAHRHSPCNGVWLCGSCHRWVHDHPFEARSEGMIVSRSTADPGTVPVKAHFGWLWLHDDGKFDYVRDPPGETGIPD